MFAEWPQAPARLEEEERMREDVRRFPGRVPWACVCGAVGAADLRLVGLCVDVGLVRVLAHPVLVAAWGVVGL